jgi:hypothetical protein
MVAIWAPITVLVLHSILGGMFGHEPYVDPVIHFLGGVAAALFFWRAAFYSGRYLGVLSPLALGLMAFGLAATAAVVWEIGEFASDLFLGTNIQRDVSNTMRDLILGVSGAGLLVMISWIIQALRASPSSRR